MQYTYRYKDTYNTDTYEYTVYSYIRTYARQRLLFFLRVRLCPKVWFLQCRGPRANQGQTPGTRHSKVRSKFVTITFLSVVVWMKFTVAIDAVCCLGHHRRILVGGKCCMLWAWTAAAIGAKLLCCCAVGMGVKGAKGAKGGKAAGLGFSLILEG